MTVLPSERADCGPLALTCTSLVVGTVGVVVIEYRL
jgi:hypothetical protein